MTSEYKEILQKQKELDEPTKLITSALVLVTLLRDQPLTDYEKEVIKNILLKYKGTPDYKLPTLTIELKRLYNQGDKDLESLVTTLSSVFD